VDHAQNTAEQDRVLARIRKPRRAPPPEKGGRETRVVFVDVAGVGTGPAEVLAAYPDGDLLVRYRGHCYVVSPRGRG